MTVGDRGREDGSEPIPSTRACPLRAKRRPLNSDLVPVLEVAVREA